MKTSTLPSFHKETGGSKSLAPEHKWRPTPLVQFSRCAAPVVWCGHRFPPSDYTPVWGNPSHSTASNTMELKYGSNRNLRLLFPNSMDTLFDTQMEDFASI